MQGGSQPCFRTLFEEAPGLFLVLDPELVIRGASNAYLAATMTERDAIVGRPLFEVFPDNPDDQNADGVSNLAASLERVKRLGKPDAMALQKYDIRRPDGSFEERYWSPLNAPVFEPDGELAYIIHRVEDVTDLARMKLGEQEREEVAREQLRIIDQLRTTNARLGQSELDLRASQRLLRETQRIAKIGAWRYIRGFPWIEWSDEVSRMFGREPSGAAELDYMYSVLIPEGRAEIEAFFSADPPPASFSTVLKLKLPDGKERFCWMEGHADPQDRNALTGILQDVTDRETAAAQLFQAQKMESVGQLTGGLAHDFNNLLAVVIGNLEMVQQDLPADSLTREFADTALEAALKGSELTRQLLAFARRQPLDPQVLDINDLLVETGPLWRRTLGENVSVRLGLDKGLWAARVDKPQLESALLNLVINARDAMPGGGNLTVETLNASLDGTDPELASGDYAVIAVSDTGEGMTPEVLARASEPFFTTKGVGKGSGLGLSMVYGFARQSGGQLKIYSEVGHGTTIRLYLPRSGDGTAQTREAPPPARVEGKGERVLVVEDNPDVRRVAVRQLTELGYFVVQAADGHEGLKAIAEDGEIDLVFTDIVMPGGMTGADMVEQARKSKPDLKVLFTTGFTAASTGAGRPQGAKDRLLSKPYRRQDLAAALRQALAE